MQSTSSILKPTFLITLFCKLRPSPEHGDPVPAMPFKVLIADSNRMGCELLANAVGRSRSLHIVALVVTVADLLMAARESAPDVALIGANLSEGPLTGFSAVRELCSAHPSVRCIMLLDNCERELIIDAFRAGAKGLFRRSESINSLVKCITAVHNGQIWANSTELQYLLEALANAVPLRVVNANGKRLLSEREEQLVALVAEGMTNREISNKLKLSEHTVKNYLFRIFDKVGISTRVELILYALSRHGSPGASRATDHATTTMDGRTAA